jgi:hypothetical protein
MPVQVNQVISEYLVNFFAKLGTGKVSAVCKVTGTTKSEYSFVGRIAFARHSPD